MGAAQQLGSSGWQREEVYAGGRHVATYTNGTTYFDHADWLGTERMRTTVSGSECETIVSLAFGDGTATTGSCSDASPMHFTGKQHDDESNLDDFDARYYSSQWGRFISADWSADPEPVPYANLTNPQTLNLYAIVADNPDTFADLDGHEPGGGSCGGGVEACQDQKDSQGGISAACSETKGTAECKEEADEKTLKTASVNDGANGQQDVVKDIPAQVKRAIAASVKASDSPTTDDKQGGFHEEGGIWGRDVSGNVIAIPAKPGKYADPTTDGAEIDPTVPAHEGQNSKLVSLDGQWHVHPSGMKPTAEGGVAKFRQDPNGNDEPNAAKFPVNIVVGAGSGQVYFYNTGKITQQMSLKKFMKEPQ